MNKVVLDGEVSILSVLDGGCSITDLIDGEIDKIIKVRDIDYYTGSYEVTPSQETQVLNTYGLGMSKNVTINPIPSNYGLITWNGSYLTVS